MKSIDGGNVDVSTIRLYLEKVCPNIRTTYDRNVFLNDLIQDLYFRCEDIMIDKMKGIEKLQRNQEKLGEVAEMYKAVGSDAENNPDAFVDNDGNPLKIKSKKSKMCEHMFKKTFYEDEGIKMKTKDSYFIKTTINRIKVRDPKTDKEFCMACPKGASCKHAHNPIELDLIPHKSNMKQITENIKNQTTKMKSSDPT